MDSNPFSQPSKFLDLLNSQQSIFFGNNDDSVSLSSSQSPSVHNLGTDDGGETGTQRKERQKWTPKDDIVLISWKKMKEMNTLDMMFQISNKEKAAEVHMSISTIPQICQQISPIRWVFEQEFVIDKHINN